jgi:hypothetical protein
MFSTRLTWGRRRVEPFPGEGSGVLCLVSRACLSTGAQSIVPLLSSRENVRMFSNLSSRNTYRARMILLFLSFYIIVRWINACFRFLPPHHPLRAFALREFPIWDGGICLSFFGEGNSTDERFDGWSNNIQRC